jgi:DNA-binding GntR family transcriptional regulator
MDIRGDLHTLPRVNHADPRPAYRQIADALRDWIDTLPPGTKLPTTAQIAGYFDVSPGCRDMAINLLKNEGVIDTARGVGMFVAAKSHRGSPEPSLASLARLIADTAAELARRLEDTDLSAG